MSDNAITEQMAAEEFDYIFPKIEGWRAVELLYNFFIGGDTETIIEELYGRLLSAEKKKEGEENDYDAPEGYGYSGQNHDTWKSNFQNQHKINLDQFDINPRYKLEDFIRQNYNPKLPTIKIFKDSYIQFLTKTPDATIHRSLARHSNPEADPLYTEINLTSLQLERVPYFIRKFSELGVVNLSNNNITTINQGDFPERVVGLYFDNCKELTTIEKNALPYTNNLSFKDCSNLTLIHYPITNFKGDRLSLNLNGTPITSFDQVFFDKTNDIAPTINVSMPYEFERFDSKNLYFIYDICYIFRKPLSKIKTFYGLRGVANRPRLTIKIVNDNNENIYDDTNGEVLFAATFPSIKNAYKKYLTYLELENRTDKPTIKKNLGDLYKQIEPESVLEFDLVSEMMYTHTKNTQVLSGLIKNLLK